VTRVGDAVTQVRNPAVDPAGAWIVYEANLDGHSDLFRLDLATNKTTRLTDNPEGNFAPAVIGASDVVFVSSRDGDSEVYRMSAATPAVAAKPGKPAKAPAPARLTAFHRDDWHPAVSPDGTTIAFVSDREGRPRIFLMGADGTRQRRLTTRSEQDVDEIEPVWSPDGKALAYIVEGVGTSHVWFTEIASGTERIATPRGARDVEPAFSPDAAWLAVTRSIGADVDLYAVPVAGGEAVRIKTGPVVERLARWR